MFNGWKEIAPKKWIYSPKEDITTYELAIITGIFYHTLFFRRTGGKKAEEFDNWNLVRRYFRYE